MVNVPLKYGKIQWATESLLQGYVEGKDYEMCHDGVNHSQWVDICLDP